MWRAPSPDVTPPSPEVIPRHLPASGGDLPHHTTTATHDHHHTRPPPHTTTPQGHHKPQHTPHQTTTTHTTRPRPPPHDHHHTPPHHTTTTPHTTTTTHHRTITSQPHLTSLDICYPEGCAAPGQVPCQCNTRGSLSKLKRTPPQAKINVTSKSPVGDISVVTLIRTDTTLDHSQKAEKV